MEEDFSNWMNTVAEKNVDLENLLYQVNNNTEKQIQIESQLTSSLQHLAYLCIDRSHEKFPTLYNQKGYLRARATFIQTFIPVKISRSRKFSSFISMLDSWPMLSQ